MQCNSAADSQVLDNQCFTPAHEHIASEEQSGFFVFFFPFLPSLSDCAQVLELAITGHKAGSEYDVLTLTSNVQKNKSM